MDGHLGWVDCGWDNLNGWHLREYLHLDHLLLLVAGVPPGPLLLPLYGLGLEPLKQLVLVKRFPPRGEVDYELEASAKAWAIAQGNSAEGCGSMMVLGDFNAQYICNIKIVEYFIIRTDKFLYNFV